VNPFDEAVASSERQQNQLGPPRRGVGAPELRRPCAFASELERDHLAARIATRLERVAIHGARLAILGAIQDLPEQRRFPLRSHVTSVL